MSFITRHRCVSSSLKYTSFNSRRLSSSFCFSQIFVLGKDGNCNKIAEKRNINFLLHSREYNSLLPCRSAFSCFSSFRGFSSSNHFVTSSSNSLNSVPSSSSSSRFSSAYSPSAVSAPCLVEKEEDVDKTLELKKEERRKECEKKKKKKLLEETEKDKQLQPLGICFEIQDKVGELQKALGSFTKNGLSLTRIESKYSPLNIFSQQFYAHFVGASSYEDEKVKNLFEEISKMSLPNCPPVRIRPRKVPWFPKRIQHIDLFAVSTLDAGTDLSSDHPGFKDMEYRRRRSEIVANAESFQSGDEIPLVDYNDNEKETWRTVYSTLRVLYEKYACKEFLAEFVALEKNNIYSQNFIPQLRHVSEYLHARTGFSLRPVTGLLSSRDFLNALAYRVFFSTQYIRHHSVPLYTPEPDVVHELLGHAPLLANPDFAELSQIIGIASLGATDMQIKELATLYWFSVEFGLLYQEDGLKAYGAGVLSSFGELQHACSNDFSQKEVREFDPYKASVLEYPITTYQPVYFAGKDIDSVKDKLLRYVRRLKKPFSLRFDKETQTVLSDVSVQEQVEA